MKTIEAAGMVVVEVEMNKECQSARIGGVVHEEAVDAAVRDAGAPPERAAESWSTIQKVSSLRP